MTPERWRQLDRVYDAVVALPEGKRAGVIAELCGNDHALRNEVESLLAQEGAAANAFLEVPAFAGALEKLTLVGRRIGSYFVRSPLGVGGMGEVYRAHDEQLGRDVAIKTLPPIFSSDPQRLARFKREARMLAALNHPHIGAIYGHEEIDGAPALVLELVEGETLAERLSGGAQAPSWTVKAPGPIASGLPLKEALTIARQIAEALEAAHDRGIIHRDLKPANIKITSDGVVKVLDFGLAKLVAADTEEAERNLTPLQPVSRHDTHDGMILGTVGYMSPEQVAGRAADKRSDLWAFGVVVLEMLSGRPVFAGASESEVLAAVLHAEPDWTTLPAETPVSIRKLLKRCLEKDRMQRPDSACVARLEIEDALANPEAERWGRATTRFRRAALATTIAMLGVALGMGLVMWLFRGPAPQAPVLLSRFAIVTPPVAPLNVSSADRDLALAPDGRHVAYRFGGTSTAAGPLMVRAIDQLDARPLSGITNAYAPFFSPDGRWIAFFENAEIKKVSITGGPVITLGAVNGAPLGGTWGDDGMIVFATNDPQTGLWRVSSNGGEPIVLTTPDAALNETDHQFPSVLPGSRAVLFTVATTGQADTAQVAALDLTTGKQTPLVRGGNQAECVDCSASSGQSRYLIYAAAGTLRAARFDPIRLELLSDPVTVVEQVMMKPSGAANYAVSRSGMLVYVPGGAGETPMRSLVWVDRRGNEEPIDGPLRGYGPPRISPDGTRAVAGIVNQGNTDVWILPLEQGTPTRLTFDPSMDSMPLWTPDGKRIIFMSATNGVPNLYSKAADGSGTADRLTTSEYPQWPTSITSDGTRLFGFELGPKNTRQVFVVHLLPRANPSHAAPRVETLFQGNFAEISPNGRYLAYQSHESGLIEVHVRPFPEVDRGRWQITTGGGTRPVWARSGRELFYLDESGALTGVAVETSGPTLIVGSPTKVFDTRYVEPNPARHYDVSPDGQRFLVIKDNAANPAGTPADIVVVQHWTEELRARVR